MTTAEFSNGLTFVISQKTGSTVTNLYPITKLSNVRYTDDAGNIVTAEARIMAIESAAATDEAAIEALQTAVAEIQEANDGQLVPDYSEETVSNLRFLRNDNTWADIQSASLDQAGVVQLSKATNLDSDEVAATASAVKAAYDHADEMIPLTMIGQASGVAPLDDSSLVPAQYLPSYVDDVVEGTAVVEAGGTVSIFMDADGLQITPETGKIYVDALGDSATQKTYRWGGSQYVEVSSSLTLGTTNSTAFYGDLGQIAYDYSQATHMAESSNNGYVVFDGVEYLVYTHPTSTSETNPHDTTAADVGLGDVENMDGQTLVNTYIVTDEVALVDNTTNLEHPGAMSADMLTQLQGLMNVYVQSTEPEITDTTSSTVLWLNTSES